MEKRKNELLISKQEIKNKISQIAKQLLKDMGIKVHLLGFGYWQTAISIVNYPNDINIRNADFKMMWIYEVVAKTHKTTASKVERAMRHSYEGLNLNEYFNVTYKINNTALLFLLQEEILNRMNITPTI